MFMNIISASGVKLLNMEFHILIINHENIACKISYDEGAGC